MSQIQNTQNELKALFGRKLRAALEAKSWNQSDLAKATGLGRDSISTYIRGLTMPDPKNLKKLAEALELPVKDLMPEGGGDAVSAAFEISQASTGRVFMRINQAVSFEQAARIMAILTEGGKE